MQFIDRFFDELSFVTFAPAEFSRNFLSIKKQTYATRYNVIWSNGLAVSVEHMTVTAGLARLIKATVLTFTHTAVIT